MKNKKTKKIMLEHLTADDVARMRSDGGFAYVAASAVAAQIVAARWRQRQQQMARKAAAALGVCLLLCGCGAFGQTNIVLVGNTEAIAVALVDDSALCTEAFQGGLVLGGTIVAAMLVMSMIRTIPGNPHEEM